MTPAEIQNLINSLIIDNNTNQITPAKMRFVLKSINEAIKQTDASAVFAIAPLFFDPFTNQFTIQKSSELQDGYLSKEDFLILKNRAIFNTFKFLQKGFGNSNLSINEVGDIFSGWKNDGTVRYTEAKWLGGALNDSDNFLPLVQTEI